jgi:hypothetical protein
VDFAFSQAIYTLDCAFGHASRINRSGMAETEISNFLIVRARALGPVQDELEDSTYRSTPDEIVHHQVKNNCHAAVSPDVDQEMLTT